MEEEFGEGYGAVEGEDANKVDSVVGGRIVKW
jgi:hypothetical protein